MSPHDRFHDLGAVGRDDSFGDAGITPSLARLPFVRERQPAAVFLTG
jgi:hypothetical protein